MRSRFRTSDALTLAAGFTAGATMAWLAFAVRQRITAPGPISDDIIAQRVRARVGEVVSRPDQVTVQVDHGVVRVSGQAPSRECDELLASLLRIPGVFRVRNALGRMHEAPRHS